MTGCGCPNCKPWACVYEVVAAVYMHTKNKHHRRIMRDIYCGGYKPVRACWLFDRWINNLSKKNKLRLMVLDILDKRSFDSYLDDELRRKFCRIALHWLIEDSYRGIVP